MDPNETLRRLRYLMRGLYHPGDPRFVATDDQPIDFDNAEALVTEFRDAFADLDEWLSRGGCAPDDWDGFEAKRREFAKAVEGLRVMTRICGRCKSDKIGPVYASVDSIEPDFIGCQSCVAPLVGNVWRNEAGEEVSGG